MDTSFLIEGVGVAGTIFSTIFGTVTFLLRRNVHQIDESLKDHQLKLEQAQKELTDFKLYVATHHVTQDELSKSLDRLDETIKDLVDAIRESARDTRESINQLQTKIDGKADK
ncbi:hypothetical protein ACO0K2_19660 [Undibacterium sp. MH2W]|uniref:hypothetical protein n=1 Tax=Undibacterium sp. MH2W TaxID=3413044 RepID=UPI003BF12EBD